MTKSIFTTRLHFIVKYSFQDKPQSVILLLVEAIVWGFSVRQVFLIHRNTSVPHILFKQNCRKKAYSFVKKETPTQVCSCEFRKIFRNIFLIGYFPWFYFVICCLRYYLLLFGNWHFLFLVQEHQIINILFRFLKTNSVCFNFR